MTRDFRALENRIDEFVRTWKNRPAKEFRRYAAEAYGEAVGAEKSSPGSSLPYWLLLPRWLAGHFDPKQRTLTARTLDEILYGQFCLYLSVRIKDDLFDEQAQGHSLTAVARLFREESRASFGRLFPRRSAFWQLFETSSKTTTASIQTVDLLQQRASCTPKKMISLFPRVCSVLNVGPSAVCLLLKKPRLINFVLRFSSEVAIAGHLLDDLEDVAEDYRRGRVNSVGLHLLRKGAGRTGEPIDAATVMRSRRMVFDDVQLHLSKALKTARQLPLPKAVRMIRALLKGTSSLQKTLHHRDVQRFFAWTTARSQDVIKPYRALT